MPRANPPLAAADREPGRVDRGQRIAREAQLRDGHDGKERAYVAQPLTHGRLPADMTNHEATTVTVEDVVEMAQGASAWEALEDDDEAI